MSAILLADTLNPNLENLPPLLSYTVLKQIFGENEQLKASVESYQNYGFCWAVSMANAVGILESGKSEGVLDNQVNVLKTILEMGGTLWHQFDNVRQAVLKGEMPIPIDSISGGMSRSVLWPVHLLLFQRF